MRIEQLGELHGIRRRALAQVVGDDPQIERALVAGVAADPPDEHVVAAARVDRQRIERRVWVVEAPSRPVQRGEARAPARARAARASAR